jgi:hypothetical protein
MSQDKHDECHKINTMDVTGGTETAFQSRVSDFGPVGFNGICITQSLVFWQCFVDLVFFFFLFVIALSVLNKYIDTEEHIKNTFVLVLLQ